MLDEEEAKKNKRRSIKQSSRSNGQVQRERKKVASSGEREETNERERGEDYICFLLPH